MGALYVLEVIIQERKNRQICIAITFMMNSITNIPRNIASVEIKNMGIESRREVVSIAMVMQLRRIIPIIAPLNRVVCINGNYKMTLFWLTLCFIH